MEGGMKSRFPLFENFLDFVYVNLKEMGEAERWRIAGNVLQISVGRAVDPSADLSSMITIQKELKSVFADLPRIQSYIRYKIEGMFYQLQLRKRTGVDPNKEVGGVYKRDNPHRSIKLGKLEINTTLIIRVEGGDLLTDTKRDQPFDERRIVTRLNFEKDLGKNLEYQLYQSMEGMPVKALCQCEECEKIFVHTSKQPRRFCENKCAARQRMRKIRTEQKEKNNGSSGS